VDLVICHNFKMRFTKPIGIGFVNLIFYMKIFIVKGIACDVYYLTQVVIFLYLVKTYTSLHGRGMNRSSFRIYIGNEILQYIE